MALDNSVYYLACCGNSCVFAYIISVTDLNYCPSFRWTLKINNSFTIGTYNSCAGDNCTYIWDSCTSSTGNCSKCCQDCCNNNGICEYRKDLAMSRWRSASNAVGDNPGYWGATYTNFDSCSQNCGCTVLRNNGINTLNVARADAISSISNNSYVGTEFLIEKVRLSTGAIVGVTYGAVYFSYGIWGTLQSYTGSDSSGSIAFPNGTFWD